MVRLLALLAVTVSTLSSFAAAFSTMPGACRLSGMKLGTSPHTFAPSTGATYTVSVQPSGAPNTYTVTLSGSGTFTGMLLFAQDSMNGTRFGSFTNIPSGYAALTTCGDINPASNTLGHNSAAAKSLPVSFTWTDLGYTQPWTAVFSGIIMSSNITQWFTSTPLIFSSVANASPMASSMSMSMSSSSVDTAMTTSMASMTSSAGGMPTPAAGGASMSGSMSGSMMMNTTMNSMASGMPSVSAAAQSGSSAPGATPTISSSSHLSVSLILGLVVAVFVVALS